MHVDRIVVIGASSGGIDALRAFVAALPADFPTPIAIVMHTSPQSPGILDQILGRAGTLTAVMASNGERVRPGRIYVAPPDLHLIIEPGTLRLTKGPKENRFRPAIDPLFRSAAQVYGPAATGVVLTGNLDDGTAGLWAIKQLGGISIVQDPSDAQFPDMPRSALTHCAPDYVVPIAGLAPLLVALSERPVEERPMRPPEHVDFEVKIAAEHNALDAGLQKIGAPSSFACPDCHGVLLELKDGDRARFRCHTGHAYSLESLVASLFEGIEQSLWTSTRSLEEGVILLRRVAGHLQTSHKPADATELLKRADELREQSDAIRRFISERAPLAAIS